MKSLPAITAGTWWTVESGGVTVFRKAPDFPRTILYPRAGLWALLADPPCPMLRASRRMAVLMSVSLEQAEIEVGKTIQLWQDAGLLERA